MIIQHLLAKYLLNKNQLVKFVPDLLIRNHYTKSQTFLNKTQRQKNLKKAFVVNHKKQHLVYNKKNIAMNQTVLTFIIFSLGLFSTALKAQDLRTFNEIYAHATQNHPMLI